MVMRLEKVVPFGRSLDEYIKMFNLTPVDLQQRILNVANGPASFNADIIAQVKATPADWVWTYHQPDSLRHHRLQVMQEFTGDYELGKQQQRYQVGTLCRLALGVGVTPGLPVGL